MPQITTFEEIDNSILIYKGQPGSFTKNIKNADGTARDLTGLTVTMFVKNNLLDSDIAAILTKVGTIAVPASGQIVFSFIANDTLNITNRYYPYIIKANNGTQDELFGTGTFNVNDVKDYWQWAVDIGEGIELLSLRDQANALLRYQDWSVTDLNEWANDGAKDFSRRTYYFKTYAKTLTKFGQKVYTLPHELVVMDSLYLDRQEIFKNFSYVKKSNTIELIISAPLGDKELIIRGSKAPQDLDTNDRFLELIPDAAEAIVYYICWKAKTQDREWSEADMYLKLYMDYVDDFTNKEVIENDIPVQLQTVNQFGAGINRTSGLR